MTSVLDAAKRVAVTACALTHTTDQVAGRLGVAPFLPKLFVDRFTHLGGFTDAQFRNQLAACRTFEDAGWASHWQGFARAQLVRADKALSHLGGPAAEQLVDLDVDVDVRALGELLAPAVTILADRGAVADPDAVAEFCRQHPESADAAEALDALIKTLVYEFAAAWPGFSPHRLRAYKRMDRLTEVLVTALAPAMGCTVDVVQIPSGGGDVVRGYLVLPQGAARVPTVLVTNGLEGSIAEVLFPMLARQDGRVGLFVMEMPGTYGYTERLTVAGGQSAYSKVIDYLVADPRVDADRIGMFGASFGGYWSTRMAAVDDRLKAVVSNGPLADRSFSTLNSVGMPEIMVWTLLKTLGASNPIDLSHKLSDFAVTELCSRISAQLLVINGAHDTLVDTQDSIDIAAAAPDALLALYAGDDHCAMGNAEHWSPLAARFLRDHLTAPIGEAHA
ncbi:S9 family peptidase [Mycobacterium sp. DBP42]|uniref:alpha/beta hydrolase family protein n=1 Tax=Mycobacterium sp. DBP42 TaxID=2545267 RepID=UPI00110CE26C|nr:alpha/beta hydrolase [Mycobacterium sp. DBP42]TMS52412.1 alpha/beta hydrolase [Mycobacterium sp. DBP42]